MKVVNELAGQEAGQEASSDVDSPTSEYKNLIVTKENKVTKIILNRPNKKNALTVDVSCFFKIMY